MGTESRMKWWKDAKFGMMIHWGLYSVLAGEYKGQRMDYIGEWIMSRFHIPYKEYEKLAADFDIKNFNADEVVRLAKNAGMNYIIFTAKHHEGFCMYHSKVDSYNITDMSPGHRDPLKELSEACEKYDMKLCLYYSQALDWHEEHAGGGREPGNKGMFWGNNWDFTDYDKKDFSIYFEKKCKPQIREILSNYGKIHLLWFDCPATINEEQCRELYNLVKELQPDCIMNSRLGKGMGDYKSLGDNLIPYGKVEGDWEAVTTLNDTWGYKYFDNNWKKSDDLIRILAGLASKGINYVVNIGPDGSGKIPQPSIDILNDVGKWTQANGEAIYGTDISPFDYDFDFGYITMKDKTMYITVAKDVKEISISGVKTGIESVSVLSLDENVKYIQTSDERHIMKIVLPDETSKMVCPVIKVVFKEKPEFDTELMQQGDDCVYLPAAKSSIVNSEKEETSTLLNHAETDAVALVQTNKISIAPLGCTNNWLDCDNYIEWEFKTYKDNTYDIELVTSGARHGTPWKGGHTVNIVVDDESRTIAVNNDRQITSVNARYYESAVTLCGKCFIKAGKHKIKVKAEEILNNDNVGLAVLGVNLISESNN